MSEAAVGCEPLANRQSTFAVWVGRPSAGSMLIGYPRLDDQVRWVARTLGSASPEPLRAIVGALGQFETRRRSRAGRRHVSIGTVRRRLVERGF
jgi:hypothetical protein